MEPKGKVLEVLGGDILRSSDCRRGKERRKEADSPAAAHDLKFEGKGGAGGGVGLKP